MIYIPKIFPARCVILLICLVFFTGILYAQEDDGGQNPVIFADAPDMSMIRVGDTYYMSSTTMHMSPGVPIMKSEDLVNWEIVNYAYDVLGESDALDLANGENAYGRGSWASCLRYHDGRYYVSTFSGTTNRTYIYSTADIENGPWERIVFEPSYHDHTIFFDDDGKAYMIWGAGNLRMVELKPDLSGVIEGTERILIENASAPAGDNIMLQAEGSQLFKVNGKYYLFNIVWPRGGMRTVLVHRADRIGGPYEGKVMLQDRGIAQGGLIDTPDGRWYAYLFRDYGSVGRIPYLAPVTWEDGWPVIGVEGKVPGRLELPEKTSLIPGIVASDDFDRKEGDAPLPLVWQWNHNPDNDHWEINGRAGYLRITTGRVDSSVLMARNMLTQRTIGPTSTGSTKVDVTGMKDGDIAGLMLLQRNYGYVGVKMENGKKSIVMVRAENDQPLEIASLPLDQADVYLRASCDFTDLKDQAEFFYSLDGNSWNEIGDILNMRYTLPHFMGYRFGLFNYATEETGGYVDFDYFRISEE